MSESLTSAHGTLGLLLEGKTVVLAGSKSWQMERLTAVISREGGQVVSEVTDAVDIVIVGQYSRGTPAAVKTAEKLNKKGAGIKILDENDVYQHLLPDNDSIVRLMRSGDGERFNDLINLNPTHYSYGQHGLADADLSGVQLNRFLFHSFNFEQFRFCGAYLHELNIGSLKICDFAEARIFRVCFYKVEGCTFNEAELEECRVGLASNCDWSASIVKALTFQHDNGTYSNLRFCSARIDGFIAAKTKFVDCDFSEGAWQNGSVYDTVFERCSFKNAKLENCRFLYCTFIDCDLSDACFKDCNLAFLITSGTKIDNAGFECCNLSGASLGALDLRKARGLQEAVGSIQSIDIGKLSSVKELENVIKSASLANITFELQGPFESVQCRLANSYSRIYVELDIESNTRSQSLDVKDTVLAMELIATVFNGYEILPSAVDVSVTRGLGAKETKKAFLEALYESFGRQAPDEKELKRLDDEKKAQASKKKADWLTMLRGGPSGIEKWNEYVPERGSEIDLQKMDLSGCDLTGVNFTGVSLNGTRLQNSVMKDCVLKDAFLNNTNLAGADLSGAQCQEMLAASADFTNAILENADLTGASVRKSKFCHANLRGADLTEAYLHGADFSDADMAAVDFFDTSYDQKTIFPPGIAGSKGLNWCGSGTDPALAKAVLEDVPKQPLDFSSFLERLQTSIDKERLKKAIKMLQAESFSLFAEVKPEYMIGVVKSQTDPDLVYSCQLTAEGKFCCGTQNLNACGGLRGALCKHLLVLLVGLTKAGELDATVADTWARASKLQAPKMDKDMMSETFLRYKGAEAGEIDWRPTETIPEDYYAF